eukprot:8870765-Lingulodinium_polyedra.AAC.1
MRQEKLRIRVWLEDYRLPWTTQRRAGPGVGRGRHDQGRRVGGARDCKGERLRKTRRIELAQVLFQEEGGQEEGQHD